MNVCLAFFIGNADQFHLHPGRGFANRLRDGGELFAGDSPLIGGTRGVGLCGSLQAGIVGSHESQVAAREEDAALFFFQGDRRRGATIHADARTAAALASDHDRRSHASGSETGARC